MLDVCDQVTVVTTLSGNGGTINDDGIEIFPIIKRWKGLELLKILKVVRDVSPDRVLFQYVPFLYERKGGINFSIVLLMFYLRFFKRVTIEVIYHELHYPIQGNIKAVVMYLSHMIMLLVSGVSAKRIFCSTEFFTNFVKKLFLGFKKNVFHLPVLSNISKRAVVASDIFDLKKSLGIDKQLVVGLFGKFHPSKDYPLVLESLAEVSREIDLKFKILAIGATAEEISNQVPLEVFKTIEQDLVAVGFVNDSDFSKYISLIDLMVAYFVDGVSTRRGSILPALDHGKLVISTQTFKTDRIFEDQEGIILLSSKREQFKRELKRFFKAIDRSINYDSKCIVKFFGDNFSDQVVVNRYLKISRES